MNQKKRKRGVVEIQEPLIPFVYALETNDCKSFNRQRLREVLKQRDYEDVFDGFFNSGFYDEHDRWRWVDGKNRPCSVFDFLMHWLHTSKRIHKMDMEEMIDLVAVHVMKGNMNQTVKELDGNILKFIECLPRPRMFVDKYKNQMNWYNLGKSDKNDKPYPYRCPKENDCFAKEILFACGRDDFDVPSLGETAYSQLLTSALRYGDEKKSWIELFQERAGLDGTEINMQCNLFISDWALYSDFWKKERDKVMALHQDWAQRTHEYCVQLQNAVVSQNENATVFLYVPIPDILRVIASFLPASFSF